MSYENHDRWTELLMETRMSEPPLDTRRNRLTRSSSHFCRSTPEAALKQLRQGDLVIFHLTLVSMQRRSGTCFNLGWPRTLRLANPSSFKPNIVKEDDAFKRRKLGPKGKGGGKADTFQRVPVELLKLGGVASTSKGNRICFGFNLKTCNA